MQPFKVSFCQPKVGLNFLKIKMWGNASAKVFRRLKMKKSGKKNFKSQKLGDGHTQPTYHSISV